MRVLSLLPAHLVTRQPDASTAAIAGRLVGDDFVVNPAFVDAVHRVVREHAPRDGDLADEARRRGTGALYIVDRRRAGGAADHVQTEDIVGAFRVTDGAISEDAYVPNPSYRAYTRNGLPQLPPPLHAILLDHLRQSLDRRLVV